jgi:hydroxypyruvate isomerase
MVSGAGSIRNGSNDKKNHAGMLERFKTTIKAAAEYKWPNVITFSGNRNGISDEEGLANSVIVLKEAAKIAEDYGVTICMELLNSKVNHPGYMCDHTSWGVELCKQVNSPRFKLLYDIYHMQIMEGDIIRTIRDSIQYIAHFHTAGNPGRRDLDEDQELYYPAIMRAIAKLTEEGKYSGFVAHEFRAKNGVDSLRHAVKVCDV